MENINAILLVVQVMLSIALIALILIQHGKGADAGAAFGSGASATVFGARGSGNFLTKATSVLAALFFATCLGLAFLATNREGPTSLMESVVETQAVEQTTILNQPESMDLPPVDGADNAPEISAPGSDLPPSE
jgi:preprotein translocase subunit SecG